jgi:hypothetical protein
MQAKPMTRHPSALASCFALPPPSLESWRAALDFGMKSRALRQGCLVKGLASIQSASPQARRPWRAALASIQSAKWLVFMMGMGLATAVSAWEGPKVEYSADTVMETADVAIRGKLYAAPNKERREYAEGGQNMTMIMRVDRKLAWMLMSEEKMYMELDMSKQSRSDDLSGWKIEQTVIGPETIDGIKTTKSKIVMTGAKGNKLAGFWWLTKENIIVKMDAIAVDKGRKDRFKIENKNIKIGKQDPKLFEVPAGYSKMAIPDMGALMGSGGKEPTEKNSGSSGAKEKSGFGFQDALKLLK